MVEPIHLVLVEDPVHDLLEVLERRRAGAVGLLEHHPGSGGQAVGVQRLHVRLERRRGQRDVVHQQRVVADLLPCAGDRVGQVARVVDREAVAGEHQVVPHRGERGVVVEDLPHVIGEPRVVVVLAAVADQHPLVGQQVVHREGGERR